MIGRGIATRIALAALASAALGVAIVAVGITVVGADVFRALMVEAGESADHAQAMYDQSVTTVVAGGRRRGRPRQRGPGRRPRPDARPSARPRSAARPAGSPRATTRRGSRARDPRSSPAWPIRSTRWRPASNARSVMRRDFIANAAHELRTPLTNLQGYLEALRDGVIVADRATYDSLWDEAERLVRLSRSLDALAEGDAATSPPALVELDLVAAIRAALELAQPTFERAAPARHRRAARTGSPARANPDHLAQVLGNLLSNAARYTPAGGDRDRPGRAPRGRPAGLDRQHRRGHPGGRSRPRLRAVLSGREVARPGARRRRASGSPSSSSWSRRAAGGSAPSRATGRPGSGSACRPDGSGDGDRRPSRRGSRPARPTGSA